MTFMSREDMNGGDACQRNGFIRGIMPLRIIFHDNRLREDRII